MVSDLHLGVHTSGGGPQGEPNWHDSSTLGDDDDDDDACACAAYGPCADWDDGDAGDDGDAAECHGNAYVDEGDAVDYDDSAAADAYADEHADSMRMMMMMLIVSWCE